MKKRAEISVKQQPQGSAQGQPEAVAFESLVAALDGWFDKNLADLPADKRKLVEQDFPFPGCWDEMPYWQRRIGCEQWDYNNDPALEERRTIDWETASVDWGYWQKVLSLTAQEFCILRHVHDPRKFEGERNEDKTLGERVSDDVRIIERSLGLNATKSVQEWILWAQQQDWEIPSYLRALVALSAPESESESGDTEKVRGIGKQGILAVEWPLTGSYNQSSLEKALSDVPQWMEPARVAKGARGKGKGSALWNPALLAVCLADKGYARPQALKKTIATRFPEWANELEQAQEFK